MEKQGPQWEYNRGRVGFIVATGFFLLFLPAFLLGFFTDPPTPDASNYDVVTTGGGSVTRRTATEGDVFWHFTLYPLLGFLFLGAVFTGVSAHCYRWMRRYEPSPGRAIRFASGVVIILCLIVALWVARVAIPYPPPIMAWAKMAIILALFGGLWLFLVHKLQKE